jgi:porphyrinogen peroxidase
MLRNMFVGDPPGNHDRILDFSTAVTGALFFVPTADLLDAPSAAALGGASTSTAEEPARTDGSLAIGSLRRSGAS